LPTVNKNDSFAKPTIAAESSFFAISDLKGRAMSQVFKPGERAPVSGEYEIRGPRGGDTGKERTAIQGKPLPPTPKPGQSYVVHRPAHNGAGKRR
jgi:hypothetical protein